MAKTHMCPCDQSSHKVHAANLTLPWSAKKNNLWKRSYNPLKTEKILTRITLTLVNPSIYYKLIDGQNDGRQALLVSVYDFLFGFVSDTDTDTLNICQTKKTQKNSETVMLFRGRLHWLTVYVMRGRERELFLRWSRLDKLPPPRPCGFRAFIGGQHRETLRTSAVLSTFG